MEEVTSENLWFWIFIGVLGACFLFIITFCRHNLKAQPIENLEEAEDSRDSIVIEKKGLQLNAVQETSTPLKIYIEQIEVTACLLTAVSSGDF